MKRIRTLVRDFYIFRTFQEWVSAVIHIRDDLAGAKRSLRWFAYVSVTLLAPFWPALAARNAVKAVRLERAAQKHDATREQQVQDFLDRIFGQQEEDEFVRVIPEEEAPLGSFAFGGVKTERPSYDPWKSNES